MKIVGIAHIFMPVRFFSVRGIVYVSATIRIKSNCATNAERHE